MKNWKRGVCAGMAAVMCASVWSAFIYKPGTALGASPEFARSEEEWARLRDNVLEYDELEDLIAEYNTTVQTNQLDLNEFKRKYGDTKEDVSNKYREMAEEIYSSIDYPDADDMMYGMVVNSVLMAEIQAKNMLEQADENLEDSEIIYLSYKQAEKTLVTVAQTNMINYEKNQLQLQQAELAVLQAERGVTGAMTRQTNGLATQVEVLNAKESLLTAQRNRESALSSIETVRQKLLVMTGWKYDDQPEIRQVPKSDMERIARMNPYEDREAAMENNYALKINRKKLANATNQNVIDSINKDVADNEQKIGSSLVTSYQNVLAAKLAYDQAAAELELERRNLRSLEINYQHGNASRTEVESQRDVVKGKEIAIEIADLNLFQIMETYDWAVNGLASVS